MIKKTCNLCKKELPATTDFFHATKAIKSGLRARCKECRKNEETKEVKAARRKSWNAENEERLKIYNERYYSEVRKQVNTEKCRAYRSKNREKLRIQSNKQYHRNKDKISIQRSSAYFSDVEASRKKQREWRARNT